MRKRIAEGRSALKVAKCAFSNSIASHEFTPVAVRGARRRPDDNLDRTGDALPLSLAVAALVRVFRPTFRSGSKLGDAAACALGTRRVVGVAGDHSRLVVFAAPPVGR